MSNNILARINTCFIQPIFRKLTGWSDLQERLDTLHYLMNHCIDITTVPKATGELRKMQLAGAEFLRIFHEACEKHEIKYWLDYGTLLGAVRHKGYIPWDDDLDVSMTVEDLHKADAVLPKELAKYGVFYTKRNIKESALGIWDAGVICDIFTVDSVSVNDNMTRGAIYKKLENYNRYWEAHKKDSIDRLEIAREKLIGQRDSNGIWYHTPESDYDKTVFDNDTIFPLKKMVFEGYKFYVPNDYDKYLKEEFGEYMSFPKNGVLHHHGGGGNPIYMNASRKGVDLDTFIETLKGISVK